MTRSFRGQAALEFMMTYGWAILVVLAAIGALSYFGVLNPSRFTPDTCLASSGFACPGKPILTEVSATHIGNISFTVVNGLGYSIKLSRNCSASGSCLVDTTLPCFNGSTTKTLVYTNINGGGTTTTYNAGAGLTYRQGVRICGAGEAGTTVCGYPTANNRTVDDGTGVTVTLTDCNFGSASVIKGEVNFLYTNTQSGLQETLKVSVTGKPKS
jgi:hypothetical protein